MAGIARGTRGKTMICPNCGKNITNSSEFCCHCGQPTDFKKAHNQRPDQPFIKQLSELSGESGLNNATWELMLSKIEMLPTKRDHRRYLRTLLIIIGVSDVIIAAACFFLGRLL